MEMLWSCGPGRGARREAGRWLGLMGSAVGCLPPPDTIHFLSSLTRLAIFFCFLSQVGLMVLWTGLCATCKVKLRLVSRTRLPKSYCLESSWGGGGMVTKFYHPNVFSHSTFWIFSPEEDVVVQLCFVPWIGKTVDRVKPTAKTHWQEWRGEGTRHANHPS